MLSKLNLDHPAPDNAVTQRTKKSVIEELRILEDSLRNNLLPIVKNISRKTNDWPVIFKRKRKKLAEALRGSDDHAERLINVAELLKTEE